MAENVEKKLCLPGWRADKDSCTQVILGSNNINGPLLLQICSINFILPRLHRLIALRQSRLLRWFISAPRCWTAPLSPLQFAHVATRAHLMLPYKCHHITVECVNHTVTSQERLTSTNPAAQSGPKATGYIAGKISLHAPWETKVGFFQLCLNAW